MENTKEILLKSFESKVDINQDIHLRTQLKQTNNPLPVEELVEVVDISSVFQKERNIIQKYRLNGNVNIVATNVLFNWDGDYSYQNILDIRNFDDTTNEYEFTQDEVLFEDDGWFYYLTGDTAATICNRNYLEPLQNRFALYNQNGDKNWNMWLTYPSKSNYKPLIFNGVSIEDGIAIYSGTTILVDDRVMTAFICSINHGLSIEDEIEISSDVLTGYEGIYNVYQLGFGDGTYTTNTFIVDVNLGVPPSFIGTQTRFKKIVDGVHSQYMGRWFRKISKPNDVEFYNTAFASNIYKDQIYSFTYNKDFNINDFTDYLDRPLTELYVTLIKKQDYSSSAPFWTLVQSGLKTVLELSEYDINTITTIPPLTSIESDVNSNDALIFGDIVEYNPLAQTENILEVAYHRFNSKNREDNNFLEGYFYKPHHKIQAREYSDYVEIAFSGDVGVVDYATIFDDGRAVWRDILPSDFTNSTHIPFLNGCHYLYKSINLMVQRQDPCNIYNLGNVNFVIGNCDTDEQFNEVIINDGC